MGAGEEPAKETVREWVATEIEGDNEEVASSKPRDHKEGEISSSRCRDGASREGVENQSLDLATTSSPGSITGAVLSE